MGLCRWFLVLPCRFLALLVCRMFGSYCARLLFPGVLSCACVWELGWAFAVLFPDFCCARMGTGCTVVGVSSAVLAV